MRPASLLERMGADYEQELEELKAERDRVTAPATSAPTCGSRALHHVRR